MTTHAEDVTGEVTTIKPQPEAKQQKKVDGAKRLHISFPSSLIDVLEQTRLQIHAATITDTLREALKIFLYLLKQHREGKEVIVRDRATGKETAVTLFIDA